MVQKVALRVKEAQKTPDTACFCASGSLTCMPARREVYTGTQEFLWRSWGPVEPFDMPIARTAGREGYVTQFISE